MHLRLKTKITLTFAALVLAAVAIISYLNVASLERQVVRQVAGRANFAAQQVFLQAQNALSDAAAAGNAPASDSDADMRAYVRDSLANSTALESLINGEVGYSSFVYEVTIVDHDGTALISSDSTLIDRPVLRRTPLDQLVNSGALAQFRVIYGPSRAYEVTYPFKLGPAGRQMPFGEIRVAVQTDLLRTEITPSLRSAGWLALGSVLVSVLLAAIVSSISLSPLKRISAQLDRISRGEFDPQPVQTTDEFGQVSSKISRIGQQLRGVQEIFSTLRENLDQVLGGLEDGLLLFTRDGRAVMVSPAVERFLGVPADQLLGRMADDIFPAGNPVRRALGLDEGAITPVSTEVELPSPTGEAPQHVGIGAQVIAEGGTRMGALVTLTDLESRERISTQLQVSERMSAIGRIMSGVAHEVKNPLNSMRLWLESLREHLPADEELPQHALQVLDSEIDRLDTVVKRFLDFTHPVELHPEETQLADLIDEVVRVARPQIERAKIAVETTYAKALPAARVDRDLIRQALLNLVLNAVQAMPEGGQLTLTLERHGDMAEIQVKDTGVGISPEHRNRIFQLFFTTRPGGSGIGLASTFRTVQLHNGAIDFETEMGHGTSFRIELPLERPGEGSSRLRDSRTTVEHSA
jgi:signal transduction histidine kinase